ncbi:MAG: DUF58 domain-containing protein [Halobacteriaceae archaeon]
MDATLTRRGKVVVAITVLAFAMAWLFGARSLNAVVMGGAALLGVAYVSASRIDTPTVSRRVPDTGTTGDRVRVHLDVDADSEIAIHLEDDLPPGLAGDAAFDTIAEHDTLTYACRLVDRGEHTIGPLRGEATDVFGLWKREYLFDTTDTIIAFPRVHPLYESARLLAGYVGLTDEREQFDSIREYERGDALRDVNWKHSAKLPNELVVTEFAGEGATQEVMVGVEPLGGRVDSAAEAAASVAAHLLDAGLAVGLRTPVTRLDFGRGDDHRRDILTALARLDQGSLETDDIEAADVIVHAPSDGSHVAIGVEDNMHRFAELVTGTRGREVGA